MVTRFNENPALNFRDCVVKEQETGNTFKFHTVTNLQFAKSAELTDSAIDAGQEALVPISWHMAVDNPEFTMSLDAWEWGPGYRDSLFEHLKFWMNGRKLLTFTNEFGSYTDCVILDINLDATKDSYNVWKAEIKIKQIAVVTRKVTYFYAIYDDEGKPYSASPQTSGGLTIVLPSPEQIEEGDTEALEIKYTTIEPAVVGLES